MKNHTRYTPTERSHTRYVLLGVFLRLRRTRYRQPFTIHELVKECHQFDGGTYNAEDVTEQTLVLQEHHKIIYINNIGQKHGWYLER